jgi:hypothetical protein
MKFLVQLKEKDETKEYEIEFDFREYSDLIKERETDEILIPFRCEEVIINLFKEVFEKISSDLVKGVEEKEKLICSSGYFDELFEYLRMNKKFYEIIKKKKYIFLETIGNIEDKTPETKPRTTNLGIFYNRGDVLLEFAEKMNSDMECKVYDYKDGKLVLLEDIVPTGYFHGSRVNFFGNIKNNPELFEMISGDKDYFEAKKSSSGSCWRNPRYGHLERDDVVFNSLIVKNEYLGGQLFVDMTILESDI